MSSSEAEATVVEYYCPTHDEFVYLKDPTTGDVGLPSMGQFVWRRPDQGIGFDGYCIYRECGAHLIRTESPRSRYR